MKRIMTLLLAAGMVFGAATGATAVDLNMKGQWLFGFGYLDNSLVQKQGGKRTAAANSDKFAAMQRLRLQMDAVASESLSGTVMFEIGDTTWGNANSGGALGADGRIVEVMRAYIDWIVPNTELKFRMGLQGVAFPSVVGGSAIMDENAAAITASWRFNDNVALTGLWMRPYNDNFSGATTANNGYNEPANYLDNMDIFLLSLPLTFDGIKVTPWASMGFAGSNTFNGTSWKASNTVGEHGVDAGTAVWKGLMPINAPTAGKDGNNFNRAYGNMFWAGLPIGITALDPWNFELDLNYGYSEGFGRYNSVNASNGLVKRADSKREGWMARGLVEYKMDWGTPGLFGWYASGDDSNVKNGSERMPTLAPCGNISSFMGDGAERGWSVFTNGWNNAGYDVMLSYSGTWGLGAQIANLTFMEDLSHTVRVAYWGGTNSPSMIKYMDQNANFRGGEGLYLTTNDGLVEVNVDTTYKIYENLTATLELGYIANVVDTSTWNRHFRDSNISKGDAIKAALIFNYSF